MARYRKIDVVMWNDQKFKKLSSPQPNGKSCWQYLLTNPETSNIPGVYRAFAETLARGLGWTMEGFEKAFGEVFEKGMAKADWESGVVFIPGAVKYNRPESPNVIRGWATAWSEIPDCRLKCEAWLHLRDYAKGLGEPFEKAFREACAHPSLNQEQEQEQEQEEESGLQPRPSPEGGSVLSLFPSKPEPPKPDIAEELLAELNRARHRCIPRVRDIAPRKTSLAGIKARLAAGATPDDVRHVIAVLEAECRVNVKSREYFDAVSPFRPDNFERALAKTPSSVPRAVSGSVVPMAHIPEGQGGDMTGALTDE